MKLKRSADRKVTNLATASAAVKIKNAFGLPAGILFSCPGMTSICERICYARRTEKQYKGVSAAVLHNWDLVKDASYIDLVSLLHEMVSEFHAECVKWNAPKVFRIHWDGDFFSVDYARAWVTVIRQFSDVQFWVYTRSFTPALNVIPLIARIDNLAVYLSVDSENEQYAKGTVAEYPDVRIATLTDIAADGADIVKDIRGGSKPGAICPENTKRIPLITKDGGACVTCGLCVFAKTDVRFARLKR